MGIELGPQMRRRLIGVVGILLVLIVAMAVGPRPRMADSIRFDPASIGADPVAWLADREAAHKGVVDGAQKEIVWADPAARTRTPLSVVYIHGFSATKWETRPLPDQVAKALGANLFFTRLAGHGAGGEALAAATMADWVDDIAEAIAIGERIGERVLLVGVSTGATLAVWAARDPELMRKVAGMALLSPNFEIRGASVGLLNMPWGSYVLPRLMGETRSFTPLNDLHGKWWTTSYPSRAVFPMAALLRAVAEYRVISLKTPALFVYSPSDAVVDPAAIRRALNEWGGPKKEFVVEKSGDPMNHVIAGDILSPQTTDEISRAIAQWAAAL
jgi:pimeloyl-ACP methyl ester carboxylesterase